MEAVRRAKDRGPLRGRRGRLLPRAAPLSVRAASRFREPVHQGLRSLRAPPRGGGAGRERPGGLVRRAAGAGASLPPPRGGGPKESRSRGRRGRAIPVGRAPPP